MKRKVVFVPRSATALAEVVPLDENGQLVEGAASGLLLPAFHSEKEARAHYPNAPLQKLYLEPAEPEHLRA